MSDIGADIFAEYSNVSSTVLRNNRITDFLIRSKLRLVEHSTVIRNGKIQHWILYKEYSSTVTERLLATKSEQSRNRLVGIKVFFFLFFNIYFALL